MSKRPTHAFTAALALAAVASAPSVAVAKPATKLATCDEVPGTTAQVSTDWRVFRTERPTTDREVPLFACKRTARPVRSVVKIGISYDSIYGSLSVARLSGNVATLVESGRYSSGTHYVDLAALRVVPGIERQTDKEPIHRELTDTGALIEHGLRLGTDVPFPETQAQAQRRLRLGPISVQDAAGRRVAVPGSAWSVDGQTVTSPVDGPHAPITASTGPGTSALYYLDGALQPQRVDLQGAATGLPWSTTGITRERRSFRVAKRPAVRSYLVPGSRLRVTETRAGRLSIVGGSVNARLALGSRREVVARTSPGREIDVVATRFGDDAEFRRLRIFGAQGRVLFDRQIDSSEPGDTLTTDTYGNVAFRSGDELVLLSQERPAPTVRYVEQRISAPGGSAPILAGRVMYYSDSAGVARAVLIAGLDPRG